MIFKITSCFYHAFYLLTAEMSHGNENPTRMGEKLKLTQLNKVQKYKFQHGRKSKALHGDRHLLVIITPNYLHNCEIHPRLYPNNNYCPCGNTAHLTIQWIALQYYHCPYHHAVL